MFQKISRRIFAKTDLIKRDDYNHNYIVEVYNSILKKLVPKNRWQFPGMVHLIQLKQESI